MTFDAKLIAEHEAYKALREEFKVYMARDLTMEEQVEAKKILGKIYEKFVELYGAYHYIVSPLYFLLHILLYFYPILMIFLLFH